jgi:hypothetical protein
MDWQTAASCSWNRAQRNAGVTDQRRFEGMFRSRPLAKASKAKSPGSTSRLRCKARAIGLVLRSVSMDAQVETWIEVSGSSHVIAPDQPGVTTPP